MLPQTITIDLGGAYDISEVRYQPRFDGILNGHITAYTLAASTDGTKFTTVRTSTWGAAELMKTAKLNTTARNVRKLRFTITGARNNLAVVAEFHPDRRARRCALLSATALGVPRGIAGQPVVVPGSRRATGPTTHSRSRRRWTSPRARRPRRCASGSRPAW